MIQVFGSKKEAWFMFIGGEKYWKVRIITILHFKFNSDSFSIIFEASKGCGCSQGFGIAPRVLEYNVKIYPNFYEKSFIKGTLKPKIEKGLCYPLFTDFVKIFAAYTLKIIGKCKKKFFFQENPIFHLKKPFSIQK